ncbi:MAG: tyrosine recombinase [Chloroflexi bacterium]|nr:tyrosine recombinase [Chloroflexota bacterium]
MEQYLNRFLDSLTAGKSYSENTIAAYLNDLTQFVEYLRTRPTGPVLEPRDCTPDLLKGYLADMQGRGYASATVARKVAAVKSFFHFLSTQGILSADPTRGLESPRIEKRAPRILTHEEVEHLLAAPMHASGPKALRDRALLELLYATGMRVTEVVTLAVGDLDLDKGHITCRGKNGKQRLIPIRNETTITSLKEYLLRSRPGLVKETHDPALFLNHRGQKLTRQGLWLIIKAYADAAGISADVTPHTLRHSFAKHLLGTGENMHRLQELLGHANLSTTLIYAQTEKTND